MNIQYLAPVDRSVMNSEIKYLVFAANKFSPNYVTSYLESKEILVRKCEGRYEGIAEQSWIIKANDLYAITDLLIDERTVLELGKVSGIGNHKAAKLIWLIDDGEHKSGDELSLGYFTQVSGDEATKRDAYTIMWENVPMDEPKATFWVCYEYDVFGQPIKD